MIENISTFIDDIVIIISGLFWTQKLTKMM